MHIHGLFLLVVPYYKLHRSTNCVSTNTHVFPTGGKGETLPSVLYSTYSADVQSVISGDMVSFNMHWDFSLPPPPPTSLSITEQAVMI